MKNIIIFLVILFITFIFYKFIYYCINYKKINKRINKFYNEFEKSQENYISYNCKEKLKNKYSDLVDKCKFIHFGSSLDFVEDYKHLDKIIEKLNRDYVEDELSSNKEYFDKLFKYPLSEEQRRAIIINEDSNLIIAAAGSGKTTTMQGKIHYLIEKKNVDPRSILAISFTNSTVKEFKKKFDNDLVDCFTFHRLGNEILKGDNKKYKILEEGYLLNSIYDFFTKDIYDNKGMMKKYILFTTLYMHIPSDIESLVGDIYSYEKSFDLESLKSKYTNYLYLKSKKEKRTLGSEYVRSYEELLIANYLFINGIKYEYESDYKFELESGRQYKPDFYLPDYDIYIEHFGVNKDNKCPQFDEINEKIYLDTMDFKRRLHKSNKTNLIETYSWYISEDILFKKLDDELKIYNVEYRSIKPGLLVETINACESLEVNTFYKLIAKFIEIYKGNNNISNENLYLYLNDAKSKNNTRDRLLLEMIIYIFDKYQAYLKSENKIDFNDMINLASSKVRNGFNYKKYKYIIIDEFQDISYSRYSLVNAIQEKNHSKVIAVGDDWQSIFRFSGCDLDLFVNFKKYFSNPYICFINNTYRNSQNLIDVASNFIMKNEKGQIKKKVISTNDNIKEPIAIYYYVNNIINATERAISDLRKEGCKSIAVIGRNNADLNSYSKVKGKERRKSDLSDLYGEGVIFTTVHKAKGLEFDGVVICSLYNSIAGFPNKMSDDPILSYVTFSKDDYLYEEERRLFYVALTRTKTKCMLLVPSSNPSEFVTELKKDNKNIPSIIVEYDDKLSDTSCPRCHDGKLIIRENSKTGDKFVSCTNYPLCNFHHNYLGLVNNPIDCPRCGAYLVKRKGKYGTFYGCLNYPYCTQTLACDEEDE